MSDLPPPPPLKEVSQGPLVGYLVLMLSPHSKIHALLRGPPKIRFSTSDCCHL